MVLHEDRERINKILQDIGFKGPDVKPTKNYCLKLIKIADLTNADIYNIANAFYDGCQSKNSRKRTKQQTSVSPKIAILA